MLSVAHEAAAIISGMVTSVKGVRAVVKPSSMNSIMERISAGQSDLETALRILKDPKTGKLIPATEKSSLFKVTRRYIHISSDC